MQGCELAFGGRRWSNLDSRREDHDDYFDGLCCSLVSEQKRMVIDGMQATHRADTAIGDDGRAGYVRIRRERSPTCTMTE